MRHDLYEGVKELYREGEYATELFADAAIDFIERQSKRENPWFCYLRFKAPHFPSSRNKKPGEPNKNQAPDWAFDLYGWSPDEVNPVKRYATVVTALDRAIGRVLDSLEDAGVADNTFVFFMSDPGGFRLGREGIDIGINDPLRSGGVTCWDVGVPVVAMAGWPGKIEPGSPDLMVACAELGGTLVPPGLVLDGKNPLPRLTEGASFPHESFFFEYRSHAAMHIGDWKIIREVPNDLWQLYKLANDLSESRNLAAHYPEKVSALQHSYQDWQGSF